MTGRPCEMYVCMHVSGVRDLFDFGLSKQLRPAGTYGLEVAAEPQQSAMCVVLMPSHY